MDAEQIKEWIILQEQVRELVRRGNTPNALGVSRLFQILVLPSFAATVGWEVYQKETRSQQRTCFAVRTVWQRDEDAKKLESPIERLKHPRQLEPTLYTETIELPREKVDSFLDRFRAITIPAFIEIEEFGLDGTGYEFSFNQLFLSAKYTWWEEPPKQWKPLSKVVLVVFRYLERLIINEIKKKDG